MKIFNPSDSASNTIFIKSKNERYNSNGYYCYISNSFNNLKDVFSQNNIDNKKILIISDTKVYKLYSKEIIDTIPVPKSKVFHYIIDNQEFVKNLNTVESIIDFLLSKQFTRDDYIIALGGGVVGDIAAFVASIYLRGIKYINIPTTLLSQTDSCLGGKCGVNYNYIKNIIGSFYNPEFVYINSKTIQTMNKQELCFSMTEVIKSALIKDSEFFNYIYYHELSDLKDDHFVYNLIYNSLIIKKYFIEKDPYETKDIRTILNYGHTVGHGIELATENVFSHGQSVAYGICISNIISNSRGILSNKDTDKIMQCLKKYNLVKETNWDNELIKQIVDSIRYDKKQSNNGLRYIIIDKIGSSKIIKDVKKSEILKAIKNYEQTKN